MLEAGRGRSIAGALFPALVTCLAPRAARASWRSNVKPGSDIIMKDHRWPEWTGGTYHSIWSNGFQNGRFYGGHGSTTKGGGRKPGMFWTHWGRIECRHGLGIRTAKWQGRAGEAKRKPEEMLGDGAKVLQKAG